jgi:hypothetical protein
MPKMATHCKDDARAGLGDRMIVGIRSVDARVDLPSLPHRRRPG